MKFNFARFNIYLAAALGLLLLAAGPGCASAKEKKVASSIELHLEVNPDATDRSSPVPIYRASPTNVNVEKSPFLDEGYIVSARVVDQFGGFSIELKFNWQGQQILDGVTTDNHNRRIAIFCRFGKEARWLGAPIIRQRVSNGTLTFTPDATREEADRIVQGLNDLAKELKTREAF